MSVNIRDYVSNDHIESIEEIAIVQSSIIQALSLDNSKLERENEILHTIIKEVRKYINWRLEEHQDMYKYHMEELLEILDKENIK